MLPMPNRAPSRLRGRLGLPPRAMALVATSVVLLVGSTAFYLSELPSLAEAPSSAQDAVEKNVEEDEATERSDSVDGSAPGTDGATGESATQPGVETSGGTREDAVALPDVTFEGVTLPESTTPQTGDTSSDGNGNAITSDDTTAEDDDTSTTGGDVTNVSPAPPQESAPEDVFSSTPTSAEEEAFRQFLLNKASSISGYAAQASACASSFESDSVSADLSTRQAHRGTCTALRQQLLSEYAAVRDYVRSNNSQYCDEQGRLIGAYRCLASYVGCFVEAWNINVCFEDPGAHVSEFSGPLSATAGHLAEFHTYYDGLAI